MQVIKDFFVKNNIKDKKIAVGVSGGADSLALVLMLKEVLEDVEIIALTVDHGLRPSSYDEALYVEKIMKTYKIEHHILKWEGQKPTVGIEEKARNARYNLLADWCKNNDVSYLCVAHHLYDQAETFLMRIERGSGLFGLSSMNEVSNRDGIKILRPLLEVHPDSLKNYLTNKGIDWVVDESNFCDDFLRVRMRNFLPILEKETGISAYKLSEAVNNLQRTKSFIEDTVENIIKNHIHNWNNVCYSFDFSSFLTWHKEIRFHTLGFLIKDLSGIQYTPVSEDLLNLLNKMVSNEFESATLGGCIIIKYDLRIWVVKEYREKEQNYSNEAWNEFIKENPSVRGIKIPHKLKIALLKEKK
ncbi:MAG: tRNA lysidine(34) synthetase TilS [Alphaproteobacteria bacterium]|nr:tRNA lysidine(34) synthetase TilS [Alphaproteobacteria bacterium]